MTDAVEQDNQPQGQLPATEIMPSAQNIAVSYDVATGKIVLTIDTHARLDAGKSKRVAGTSGSLKLDEIVPGLRLNLRMWIEQ